MFSQDEPHIQSNLVKYRAFAENRRRSQEEIDQDFYSLLADPHLVQMGFMANNPHILMLETPIIDILYLDEYYRVGAFVILISRQFVDRSWRVDFKFRNLHGLLDPGNNRDLMHHPHIVNERQNDEFGKNVGYFCTEARSVIDTPLRQGRIFDAFPMFLEILTIYPTGYPFHEVHHWPLARDMEGEKQ